MVAPFLTAAVGFFAFACFIGVEVRRRRLGKTAAQVGGWFVILGALCAGVSVGGHLLGWT